MKFLILGINYAPEMIGIAVYTTGLAERLAEEGHEVQVVTALPYYPAWKVSEGWSKYKYKTETPKPNLRVTHCPLYVPAVPTGIKRLVHHATFALTALPIMLRHAFAQKPDVVFVAAPSLISAPVGTLAARLSGAASWLHVQDFEVEAAFATGLIKEKSRMGRLAKRFERAVMRRFDRVSSISRPMLQKLLEKGIRPSQIFELRNWGDLSAITPVDDRAPLRARFGIDTPHVALYSGNLANKQGLEIIPQVAERLKHRTDLTFAICGDGPMKDRLQADAADLPNVRFYPLQPKEKLSDLLGMADVHLLPQIAGAADLVLPSKLTNMLASGRPVVATALPGTALADEVEGCGLTVDPGDPDGMANAIGELLDNSSNRIEFGSTARIRAEDRWDDSRILNRFAEEAACLIGKENVTFENEYSHTSQPDARRT